MRSVPWALVWLILVAPLAAQAARSDDEQIDTILASPALTWGQAAWLVGRATGALAEAEPVDVSVAQGNRKLDVATYSALLVDGLRIPAGLMYGWFPGPRYAFRELVYRRVLPTGLEPDAPVSGQDAMNFLQNAQAWKEAHP